MKKSIQNRLESLGKIAEIKRILSVMNPTDIKESPGCYVITSGEPKEGKTTLCAGLAIAAAEQHTGRVLVIDYNWHTPTLHDYFDVEPYYSIDDINPQKPITDLVQKTWQNNLDVIPALQPMHDDQEFNVTGWSLDTLQRARETYDYIFIDTASIYPTNHKMLDPIPISKQANGVVLVALTNVTPRQTLKRACMAIQTQGATVLGVVANQWQNPMI